MEQHVCGNCRCAKGNWLILCAILFFTNVKLFFFCNWLFFWQSTYAKWSNVLWENLRREAGWWARSAPSGGRGSSAESFWAHTCASIWWMGHPPVPFACVEWMSERVSEWVNAWMSVCVSVWVSEWVASERVSEWVSEWEGQEEKSARFHPVQYSI